MDRYYVEVIGAKTKMQLVRAGISPEHILVVRDSPFSRIEEAIFEVLGVNHATIIGQSHNRYACMARALLVYFAVKSEITRGRIAEYINRPRKYVTKRYKYVEESAKIDKELWQISEKVKSILTPKKEKK